jgi:nitroreductase
MDINEFLDLVHKRRSIRRFKNEPVSDETILQILEASRWAMSGGDGQPWEYVVVKDEAKRKQILDAWLDPTIEAYWIEQTRVPELRHHHLRTMPTEPPFKDAPVLIVLLGDRRTFQASVLGCHFLMTEGSADAIFQKNMANATQNIHLAAAAAGLGSEWISVNKLWARSIKNILGIPDVLEVHNIAAIGYPAYQPKPNYRRELNEIVHYDGYDMSKYRTADDIRNYILKLREETAPPYKQGL